MAWGVGDVSEQRMRFAIRASSGKEEMSGLCREFEVSTVKTGRVKRIAMNQEERDWLEWLKRAKDGVVTQRQAAEKMGVSDRWVRKLLVRMKTDGDGVVVHGLRG